MIRITENLPSARTVGGAIIIGASFTSLVFAGLFAGGVFGVGPAQAYAATGLGIAALIAMIPGVIFVCRQKKPDAKLNEREQEAINNDSNQAENLGGPEDEASTEKT